MSITYEDVLLHVDEVRFKSWKGSFNLLKNRCLWIRTPRRNGGLNLRYAQIRKQIVSAEDDSNIISAEDDSKIQLELVLYDRPSLIFHFVNPSRLKAQRDRDQVRKHLNKLLPKFNVKKAKKEKMRTFSENPFLWKLYKRLVLVQGISEEEFWTQHPLLDLIASDDKYRDRCSNERQRIIENPHLNIIVAPSFLNLPLERCYNEFFSIANKIECKRILYPQEKRSNNLKIKFPQATRSSSTSMNQSIPNHREKSWLPTKREKKVTNDDLEQESTKLLSFSPLEPASLCSLSPEYILLPCILIHLNIHDLLYLSHTNRYMESVVKQYLAKIETLDFSKRWNEPISNEYFTILHENCRNIRELNFNKCYWLEDSQSKPLIKNNINHLEKLILKHCELETVMLLTACRNLKSVKLFSYGMNTSNVMVIAQTICAYNLNLDHIFITDGNHVEAKYWSKICNA